MNDSKRNYLFDNIKLLLIFLVVAVHLFAAVRSVTGKSDIFIDMLMLTACSFHMPLFLFISGFFSKKLEKSRQKSVDIFVMYLIIQILFLLYNLVINGEKPSLISFISPGFSMWYLLALCIMKLILPDLVKIKHLIIVSAVLNIVALSGEPSGSIEKMVVKLFANLIFFVLGYYTSMEQIQKIRAKNKLIYCAAILLSVCSIYLLVSKGFFKAQLLRTIMLHEKSIDSVGYGPAGYLWFAYVLVIALIMGISVIGIISDKKFVFTSFGKNTMTIYIGQAFTYLIFRKVIAAGFCLDNYYLNYVLAVIISVLCVVICGNNLVANFFNILIAKCKKLIFKKSDDNGIY